MGRRVVVRITAAVSLSLGLCFNASVFAGPIQWSSVGGGNDHWYEYVDDLTTWLGALAGAAARGGYLATITSQAENDFVAYVVPGGNSVLWLAGTDQDVEGVWKWAAGPESGNVFYGSGAPASAFSAWPVGLPDDAGNQDYLVMNWWLPTVGTWDDNGGPGIGANERLGYAVEYDSDPPPRPPGNVSEPNPLALLALAGLTLVGAQRMRKSGRSTS